MQGYCRLCHFQNIENVGFLEVSFRPIFSSMDLNFWKHLVDYASQQSVGCYQSNANQSPNIEIMRISRRQLTPSGHCRSTVLLECFAWGGMTFELEMIVDRSMN